MICVIKDLVRVLNSVIQLCNFILEDITIDNYSIVNDTTDLKKNKVSGVINTKYFKNGRRKVARRFSKFKIFNCNLSIVLDYLGYHIRIYVDRKVKFPIDSPNTTKNIYTINWCTVPSITSCNTSKNKYIVNTTLFSSYSHTFILKTINMLNCNPFIIALSKNITIQVQILVHSNEPFFKINTIIQHNKMANTKFH